MQVIVFEDSHVGDLAPITTGRPAYAISCASYRLIDWLRATGFPIVGAVRDHLVQLQSLDFGLPPFTADKVAGGPVLAINARLVPAVECLAALQRLSEAGQMSVIRHEGTVVAALLPSGLGADVSEAASLAVLVQTITAAAPEIEAPLRLFCWPHDVVAENMRLMQDSLAHRIAHDDYRQTADGVFLAPGATLGDYAVIDTSEGPILLDADVRVGPFCYLSGPVYAGPRTRVIEHAALKDAVSLGHTVKIGGEVEASVIEPYSNKQHHGFLGHSYLGSWINLGAGTCNSDLKNTYGTINMQYTRERIATDMQFMGCVMGDYTKTAINTGIFTGKVVGVCSMLYGFVTSNVPSFVNYARLFGQTAELPPEIMIATQQRMFARRKVQQREADQQLIRDMHRLTSAEREAQLGTL
jgi:glucose-1-phosphate thymidylyltransferase